MKLGFGLGLSKAQIGNVIYGRAVASNGNGFPFQVDTQTTNYRNNYHFKKVPLNASYTQNQWEFAWYTDTPTTETATLTNANLRAAIYTPYGYFPLYFSGVRDKAAVSGNLYKCDVVPGLTLQPGDEYMIAIRIEGPDSTSRNYPRSCVSWAAFGEGVKLGTSSAVDFTDGTMPYGAKASVTISGGNITAGAVVAGGTNYTQTAAVYAIDEDPATGATYSKQVGTAAVSGGSITGVTITSGTPASGLSAWVAPKIVVAYGSANLAGGDAIAGYSQTRHTGTPSANVKSLLIVSHSIGRGNGNALPPDRFGNQGIYEIGLANRCGVMNAGIGSGKMSLFAAYTTNYPRLFAAMISNITHAIVTDSTNDVAFNAATKSQLIGWYNTVKTYLNSLSIPVSTTTMLNRTTDATNTAAMSGFGAGESSQQWNTDVRSGAIVSDGAYIDGQLLLRDGTGVLWRGDIGTVQIDGVHPAQNGLGIAAKNATFKAAFNGYA